MEFIEFLSDSALSEMKKANDELVKMVSNVENVSKKMQNIATPSGSDNAIKNLNTEYAKQQKLIASMQIQLERYSQAQNRTKISNNALEKSEISLEQARIRNEKALQREQAKLEASITLQSKTNRQLLLVQKAYDELALKKQRYNNLSLAEEKRLTTLTGTLQKYRAIQDGVNTTVGKFQQRVGAYVQNGFNPLSNSINQLTREAPAFANSVQTGFMAISNNLPIFFDAMGNAIAQQKELQAQGLPSKKALQLLAGSFFTLGTALSLGVTALTIFGPLLYKAITDSEKKAKAIELEKKAREEQIQIEKQYADTLSKLASDEQARAKIYLENAKNQSLPLKERIKNVDLLQSRYPAYFGNLKQEEILAGNTAKAEYELNNALMKRALFLAVQDRIKDVTKELVDAEFKYLEAQQKQIDANNLYDKGLEKTTNTKRKYRLVTEQEANSTEYLKKVEEDRNKSLEKGNVVQLSATDVLRKNTIVAKDKLDILYKILNQNAKYNSVVVEETKNLKNNTEAKKKDLEVTELTNSSSLQALSNTIAKLKESYQNATIGSVQYGLLANQIKLLEEIYKGLTDATQDATDAKEEYNTIELSDEQVYEEYYAWLKLKQATDEYLKTLSSNAFNKAFDNIGLSSAKMFFDFDINGQSTFDKLLEGADSFKEKFALTFQSVGDVAQDVFNKITELSNQRFQNELINLQQEKEIALLFAGDTASAREEIERQYEQRQREIKRREFQAKKQQAIFNIAIDTAQGVVSALASTPPNVPLSIAIGVIGALQAGIVASQQIPQFWKGTDNAPEGWAWTQEKGREIITDSKGNIKSMGNDKGATKTWLNRGDKVFTAEQTTQLMHNDSLNNILTSNGINQTTKEIYQTNVDLTPVVNAINNKPSVINQIDKGGFRQLLSNGHGTKEITNRRVNGQSYGI